MTIYNIRIDEESLKHFIAGWLPSSPHYKKLLADAVAHEKFWKNFKPFVKSMAHTSVPMTKSGYFKRKKDVIEVLNALKIIVARQQGVCGVSKIINVEFYIVNEGK